MLDIKRIRQNPQELLQSANLRGISVPISELLKIDEQRKKLLAEAEEKKALRNALSKKLGIAKRQKRSEAEINELMEAIRLLGSEIECLDKMIASVDTSMENTSLLFPNYLHSSVSPSSSKAIRQCGTPRVFLWEPKTHMEIAKDLTLLETKLSSAMTISCGNGAKLERALMNYLLDACNEYKYEEISGLPLSGINTSQQRTPSMFCDCVLDAAKLPIRKCTVALDDPHTKNDDFCTNHRRFSQVEMLSATAPEQANDELKHMIACIEQALHTLNLPYQTILLSSQNTALYAVRTCSIQVWLPSQNQYVDAAAISDCEEFQARRDGLRFRTSAGEKTQYAYTIACEGIQIRTVADAILENNQNEDGTVSVPDVLVPYMKINTIK